MLDINFIINKILIKLLKLFSNLISKIEIALIIKLDKIFRYNRKYKTLKNKLKIILNFQILVVDSSLFFIL